MLKARADPDTGLVGQPGVQLELSGSQPLRVRRDHIQPFGDGRGHQPFAYGPEHLRVGCVLTRRSRPLRPQTVGAIVLDEDAPAAESEPGMHAHHPPLAARTGGAQSRHAYDSGALPKDVGFSEHTRSLFVRVICLSAESENERR